MMIIHANTYVHRYNDNVINYNKNNTASNEIELN